MSDAKEVPYPRPDFHRKDLRWQSLNGPWDFLFDDHDVGLSEHWHITGLPSQVSGPQRSHPKRKITVPFVFQTKASGVDDQGAHEVIWYERSVSDIRTGILKERGYRLLLRFGAVDYEARVWVNGQFIGDHRGGHVPFDLDITGALAAANDSGDNRVTVRVRDAPYDLTQPRGKQYWRPQPESIFYTPSSGIWQSVWLESVPSARIADSSHGTVLRSDDIQTGVLHAQVAVMGRRTQEHLSMSIEATFGGMKVSDQRNDVNAEHSSVSIDLPLWIEADQLDRLQSSSPSASNKSGWRTKNSGAGLALWSPDHPLLYDIRILLYNDSNDLVDEIETTVGMRSISWQYSGSDKRMIRLNDETFFQALVLDQGYWPETGMTPPSPEALKFDIDISKALGFNGCRKHQKVEDPVFLYWADRLGYLVWGEMANAYEFSLTYIERFDAEWKASILRDINHPSIVAWTPVNESWGYDNLKDSERQRNHLRSLYYMTKTLDPTRPVNDNCGWEHVCTDLDTFHDYADGPALKTTCRDLKGIYSPKGGRAFHVGHTRHSASEASPQLRAPILCTEFGGVNIAPATNEKAGERDWGYTTASDPEDLLKRFETLAMAVVDGGYCCGFVYTQLTDIEQEVNGLYTFDRRPKLDVPRVRAIMDKAKAKYFEIVNESE